jgi:Pectate lyase superfamily protein
MHISAQDNPDNAKRPTNRRALLAGTVLAGTVTGMVVAVGAGVALGGPDATAATAAVGVTDWINITDYGADPTGKKDSSGAFKSAIAAAAEGGVVYMPTGIFLITGPIVLQKSVTLVGDHGATSSGDDANQFAGTVIRVARSFSNPAWSHFATAAILCLDQSPGKTGSASTRGIRLRDFWIDGSSGAAGVDGITSYGPVSAWQAERVGVYRATGSGFRFVRADGSFPDGQSLYSCLAQQCMGEGFTGDMVDATLMDCHAQGCKSNGIHLTGGNTRFIGCRSDLNGGHGWYLDHSGAGTGFSDGVILDACGTQRNNDNGVFITNSSGSSWHDPVLITGCSIGEDGQNGTWSSGTISGGDGLGWAGIHVEGENHVHITNTLIAVGTKDVTTTGCPQFGIRTGTVKGAAPTAITVSGGRIEASGAKGALLIDDTAKVQGEFRISPETVGAIGYQSDAVLSRQGSAALSGGSASVSSPWVSSVTRVFLSTLQTSSPGFLSVSRSVGSFTINSTTSSDSSTVAWMLTTA